MTQCGRYFQIRIYGMKWGFLRALHNHVLSYLSPVYSCPASHLVIAVNPAMQFGNFLTEIKRNNKREDCSSTNCCPPLIHFKTFPMHFYVCVFVYYVEGGMCMSRAHMEVSASSCGF